MTRVQWNALLQQGALLSSWCEGCYLEVEIHIRINTLSGQSGKRFTLVHVRPYSQFHVITIVIR